MATRRPHVVALTLAIPILAAGLFFAIRPQPPRPGTQLGGPIRLMSQTGEVVDTRERGGAPYAVFFGFTRCPDICPTTMTDLTSLLSELGDGERARAFRIYFVSVDPERDTPAVLRDYLSNFDPRIIGLTGTSAEIAAIAKSFRAYYEKVATKDGDYTMNHITFVYLMRRDGVLANLIGYQEERSVALAKLHDLLDR